MGLKTLMLEASSFLGKRVTKAEFRSSNLANFLLQTVGKYDAYDVVDILLEPLGLII